MNYQPAPERWQADDYEERAIAAGWFKLKLGWYHVNAWDYAGWFDSPKCYKTARELCEAEGL
jgi:hypothetical protein